MLRMVQLYYYFMFASSTSGNYVSQMVLNDKWNTFVNILIVDTGVKL